MWTTNQDESTVSMELKDRRLVKDPVGECIDKAASVFRFLIEIPDPSAAAKVWKYEDYFQSKNVFACYRILTDSPIFDIIECEAYSRGYGVLLPLQGW